MSVSPNKDIFVIKILLLFYSLLKKTFGDTVNFKMFASSNYRLPLENATVIFDLHAISEDVTKIPETILPYFTMNGQTDSDGLVTLGNITFESGISSVYWIKPLLIYSLVDDLTNQNLSSTLENVIAMILDPSLRYGLSLSRYNSFMDGLLNLNEMGLIDFCFADFEIFTLVSQIGSVLLLNETQSPSTRYQLNKFYYFRVQVFNLKNIPMNQMAVNVDFNFLHFPSYLLSDYITKNISEFKKQVIEFSQLSNKTDKNGEILLRYAKIIINEVNERI